MNTPVGLDGSSIPAWVVWTTWAMDSRACSWPMIRFCRLSLSAITDAISSATIRPVGMPVQAEITSLTVLPSTAMESSGSSFWISASFASSSRYFSC